ncbi:MAG TPA: precorrin-6y C5,15-methyltransferase (decarboxylating) subunit CbiE [Thermodesulfobacteriota bacterium]|nr:precorrin-6y C5,15-methyltransferase (decarboxylating) subunit CbiE [Thermodesulfobacteriota bacterium]
MAGDKITIVGCGPGSPDLITPQALRAVERAEVLVGARRLLDLFPSHKAEKIAAGSDVQQVLREIEGRREKRVAVLVTGDPGLSSLARPVRQRFGREQCEVIPGISSVQVAFARLGLDWLGCRIVDAHGREPEVSFGELSREEKIALLSGRMEWARRIIRGVLKAGGGHRVYCCENLTLAGERIFEVKAEEVDNFEFPPLTVLIMVREEI